MSQSSQIRISALLIIGLQSTGWEMIFSSLNRRVEQCYDPWWQGVGTQEKELGMQFTVHELGITKKLSVGAWTAKTIQCDTMDTMCT